MTGPVVRPRRLRRTPAMRDLVAETTLEARQLVLPVFVREGADEPMPISSMPGVVQHTRDTLRIETGQRSHALTAGEHGSGIVTTCAPMLPCARELNTARVTPTGPSGAPTSQRQHSSAASHVTRSPLVTRTS